jgi:hypothetical protein
MAGWTWVECNINAPAKDVFDYFSDDTDKMSYLIPSAKVLNVLERERLPNGGQRVRLIMKIGAVTHEVAAEDTEFRPYSLLRGWSSGPSGTVESEKRFSEAGEHTHLVWGARVTKRRGIVPRLVSFLLPATTELMSRLTRLDALARARAALEPWPQRQAATEPAWVEPHMPPPVRAPFAWLRWGVWFVSVIASLAILTAVALLWPDLLFNFWLQCVLLVVVFTGALQLVSWAALRLVRWRLPDTRR